MPGTREVDVVIVGGGPAGISTALHLQAAAPRLAARTVVLEKQTYPRDKICAGAVGGRALRALEALGIELDVPMVKLDGFALRMNGQIVDVREPGLGVVVRRIQFDHALARAATARGIEVIDGCGVDRIEVTDKGVEVTTDTGDVFTARAVVGADGVSGIVRRTTGFPRGTLRAQVVELDTEEVAGDPARDTLMFDFATRDLHGYAWDFPTIVDDRPLMCRGVYVIRAADDGGGGDGGGGGGGGKAAPGEVRSRIEAYLTSRGLDVARYRLKHFAERGFEPGAAISAPRVLLVGEAAGIDIATGEGIAQAIEYGALAGPYLARAFASEDLGFTDWRLQVDLHHVGWQLRIRHACYRAFFGPRRPTMEKILPGLRTLFRVGARDFAGKPQSALDIVRGGAQLFTAIARIGLSR
jgi:flavin-dependent dehydrogenase